MKKVILLLTFFLFISFTFGQTQEDLSYLIQLNKIEQFESAFSQLEPSQIEEFLEIEAESLTPLDYENVLVLKKEDNDSITILTYNKELTEEARNKLIGNITLDKIQDSLYKKLKNYINNNEIRFTRLYKTYYKDSLVYSEEIQDVFSFAFSDESINTFDFTDQYNRTEFIRDKFGRLGGFGIDVSHHQGNIDWDKVYNDTDPKRLDFVILKISDGASWPNGQTPKEVNARDLFRKNVEWLTKERKFKFGAYHFFQPCSSTPEAQAKNYINWVKDLDLNILPIVDAEHIPNCANCIDCGKKKREYAQNLDKFISIIEKEFNSPVIIYTYDNFYIDNLQGKITLENRYLWLARYRNAGLFYQSKRQPTMYEKSRIIGWQYSESGKVDGIKSNPKCKIWYTRNNNGEKVKNTEGTCVDLNFIYYKNYDKWLIDKN